MVGHPGERVLAQMDLHPDGVLLFSDSSFSMFFPKETAQAFLKRSTRRKNKNNKQIHRGKNRYCSHQKGLQPFSSRALPASD